jgi:hypothetical protein
MEQELKLERRHTMGFLRKKSMDPGGGGRFAKLEGSLAKQPGVTDSGALAATIGRKKYGSSQMAAWAAKSRKATKGSPSFTGTELAAGYRKVKG